MREPGQLLQRQASPKHIGNRIHNQEAGSFQRLCRKSHIKRTICRSRDHHEPHAMAKGEIVGRAENRIMVEGRNNNTITGA
jgi:hypothetical protein